MKRRIKVNGLIIFVMFLIIIIFPRVFLRSDRAENYFDEIVEIFGVGVMLLGQIVRVSSRGYKSEHSCNGHALIQGGPYALVRNPMYLGIILIGLGIVLMLFNWWVALIFLVIFSIRYVTLIVKEEKELLGFFPEEYPLYMKRSPRILPSIATLLSMDIAEYLPLKLSWLKKEIASIVAVLLLTLLLESWKDIRSEGLAEYLKEAMFISATIALFILMVIYLNSMTAQNKENGSDKNKSTPA